MHKIYKVTTLCATLETSMAEPHRLQKSTFMEADTGNPCTDLGDGQFPGSQSNTQPHPQVWHKPTQFSFLNKSFSSSVDGKDIARSSLRPMGTPLQTSWHSATPQAPSQWSAFPAALSVTVWLVLLRSPSPASFQCHLFYTRWLLPSNLTLPSYLAPGYHPYPKVLTQVLAAGRVRVSLLLLWQAQGCL